MTLSGKWFQMSWRRKQSMDRDQLLPHEALLVLLVRCAFCGKAEVAAAACSAEDWTRMVDMAFENGVAALAADGYHVLLEQCPEAVALMETEQMEDLRYDWFGSMLQTEEEYAYKLKKASKFAAALAKRGVECKVLKGLSFAMYYDRPEHRECGDCDVYLGKDFEVGNQVVVELGGSCDGAPGKHCHLYLGSLMIENHRHLTDLHGTRQEMKTERLLERLLVSSTGLRRIGSTQLLRPSDHFNALFLIQHAYANFIFMGMSLRMVYDWAMLLKRCRETLDFARLCHDLDECRLLPFARVMTAICVDYLGLELTCPELGCDRDKAFTQQVLKDILTGGIITRGEETLWKKVVRISRRLVRFWRYRRLATESVPRLIWNNLIYNSYTHIRCDYEE